MIHKQNHSAFLSQTAEYALRAMVHMAASGGGPLTTRSIAKATHIPPGYLSKILRALGDSRILFARRGVGGGFIITHPIEQITLQNVLDAVDGGVARITSCPLGIAEHQSLCSIHQLLDDAAAELERILHRTTLADIVSSDQSRQALCRESSDVTLPSITVSTKKK